MGSNYYPRPGFEDFIGSVEEESFSDQFMIDFISKENIEDEFESLSKYAWAQIVDGETGTIIKFIPNFRKYFQENKNLISLKLKKKVIKI